MQFFWKCQSVSVNPDQPVKGDIHDQPIDLTWPHIIISSLDQNQTQSATPALLIPALLVGFTTTSFRWTVLVELDKFFILKWKRYIMVWIRLFKSANCNFFKKIFVWSFVMSCLILIKHLYSNPYSFWHLKQSADTASSTSHNSCTYS